MFLKNELESLRVFKKLCMLLLLNLQTLGWKYVLNYEVEELQYSLGRLGSLWFHWYIILSSCSILPISLHWYTHFYSTLAYNFLPLFNPDVHFTYTYVEVPYGPTTWYLVVLLPITTLYWYMYLVYGGHYYPTNLL